MASFNWPSLLSAVQTYSTLSAFPSASAQGNGALALALDSDILYVSTGSAWVAIGGPGDVLTLGNLDAQAGTAKGAALVSGVLSMQSATESVPGLINTSAQTFAGIKTFSSVILATAGSASAPGYGFSASTNTGMYDGGGSLNFAVGGVIAMAMGLSSGNFGNLGMGGIISTSDSIAMLINRSITSNPVAMQINNNDAGASSSSAALILGADNGSNLFNIYQFRASTLDAYNNRAVLRPNGSSAGLTLHGGDVPGDVRVYMNGYASANRSWGWNPDYTETFYQAIATPANAASGAINVYQTTGNKFAYINSSGTVSSFSGVNTGDQASGNLTDAGTDGITVTGGTGAVLGSGTSIAQHVADASHNGYLSSADWSTFNGKGAGTVTSVGLSVPASSLFSVSGTPVTGSGTLALATAGTSGGIPYFSSTTQLNTSALLAQYGLVIGGGAGAAPATISPDASTTKYLKSGGSGANPAWTAFTQPTYSVFTSGTAQTYTVPAGAVRLRFTVVGAGGGGGSSGTAGWGNAANGGATTVKKADDSVTYISAGGGSLGGNGGGGGGSGGTNTVTTFSALINTAGAMGGGWQYSVDASSAALSGGDGGQTPLGGAGKSTSSAGGGNAAASTGSGGGGAGFNQTNAGNYSGGGGGAGGYVLAEISSGIAATYHYTVGGGGAGGSAGTNGFAGGTGAAGYILVEEFYQ